MQRFERLLVVTTNIAVMIGLVLVILELRQNRAAIELDYNMSIADIMSDNEMAVATDRSLAEAIARSRSVGIESLDEPDQLRVRNWLFATLEPRLSYYWMRHSDIIPHDDWCTVMRLVSTVDSDDNSRAAMERNILFWKAMVADVRARCGPPPAEP